MPTPTPTGSASSATQFSGPAASSLRGKLGDVRPYDFVLEPAKPGAQPQTIPYSSVKTVNTKMAGSDKLILFGAGVAIYYGLLFAFGNR